MLDPLWQNFSDLHMIIITTFEVSSSICPLELSYYKKILLANLFLN